MKRRQRRFEESKRSRDFWFKQAYYIVGGSAIVGLASLLIYRYVGSGDEPQTFNLS